MVYGCLRLIFTIRFIVIIVDKTFLAFLVICFIPQINFWNFDKNKNKIPCIFGWQIDYHIGLEYLVRLKLFFIWEISTYP